MNTQINRKQDWVRKYIKNILQTLIIINQNYTKIITIIIMKKYRIFKENQPLHLLMLQIIMMNTNYIINFLTSYMQPQL
jgi:hypothetical protein